jgi:N-acetylmuramoyl-L-alanine amidase
MTRKINGRGVLLEIGHGDHPNGWEPGATHGGIREYDLNWVAALAAQKVIQGAGVHCEVTDQAKSLYQLGQLSADWDVFCSVHHNSFNGKAQGSEALYHHSKGDQADKDLCKLLSATMAQTLGIHDRGAKPGRLGVLSGAEDAEASHYSTTEASILVEPYFIDAPGVQHHLWSTKAGSAIGQAILSWLSR